MLRTTTVAAYSGKALEGAVVGGLLIGGVVGLFIGLGLLA